MGNLVNVAYDGNANNQYLKGSTSTMLKHVGTLVLTATHGILIEAAYYTLKDGSKSSGETVASTFVAEQGSAVNYWHSKLRTSYTDALVNAMASAPGYITWRKSQLGSLQGKDSFGNIGVSDDGATLLRDLTSALNQNYGNYRFGALMTSTRYWNWNKLTIEYNKDVSHHFMVDSDLFLDIISIPTKATPPTNSSMLGKLKSHCGGAFPDRNDWLTCAAPYFAWQERRDGFPFGSSCKLQFQALLGTVGYATQGHAKNWNLFSIDTASIADYVVTSLFDGFDQVVLVNFTNSNE